MVAGSPAKLARNTWGSAGFVGAGVAVAVGAGVVGFGVVGATVGDGVVGDGDGDVAVFVGAAVGAAVGDGVGVAFSPQAGTTLKTRINKPIINQNFLPFNLNTFPPFKINISFGIPLCSLEFDIVYSVCLLSEHYQLNTLFCS